MAFTSDVVNVEADPNPRLMPPLDVEPGLIVNTLEPKLSTCFVIPAFALNPIAELNTTAMTPMMMPSMVKKERILLARMLRHATRMISVNMTEHPRFFVRRRIQFHIAIAEANDALRVTTHLVFVRDKNNGIPLRMQRLEQM